MNQGSGSILTAIGQELPFVDREEELALLKSLFDQIVIGRAQVVFVAGEGGAGKTRLVHELGRYATAKRAIFAHGSSYEEEGLVPYSPWIEVIRTIVQASSHTFGRELSHTLAEVSRLVPELKARSKELGIKGWLSGPETGGLTSSTDAERVRLFQGVTDFLTHASKDNSLVLFFDDVLWADAASLQLLHYFCRRIRERRIMVLAAYRDVELAEDHPLSRLLLDLNRERTLRKVVLNRFTAEYVAQIVSNYLGGGSVAHEFTKLIHSRTGGNPFFVEEVLRSLVEDKRVYRSTEGWAFREAEHVEIPSTVRALIKHRVARLGNDTVQALSVGATIGMDFPYELLKHVTSQEEEQLVNQLEKAVRAGLVKERRAGREVSYIFADEQIRDFLYNDQSLLRKRKVHGRIAHAIEETYQGGKDQHVEELANHYIQAGEVAKAAEFSLMAGDKAAGLHAQPEAKKHYANVLESLREDQRKDRLEVLVKIGDASFRMGEFDGCVMYYREAVHIAGQLKQTRTIAQLHSRLGYAHWWLGNDKKAALESYSEGLRVLGEETDTPEEATICQNMARVLVISGEADAGLLWCEKAIQIAKKLNLHEVLAQALQTLARGQSPSAKNKAEIFRHLEESYRISIEHGLDDPACRAHVNLGCASRFVMSDYSGAKEIFLNGVEYARKMGYLNYEALLEALLALHAYIPLGEWDKALEVGKHSLEMGSEAGEVYSAYCPIPVAVAYFFKGDIDRAEEYLTKAYPIAERTQWPEIIYFCCWALGKLYIEKENLEKAEEYLVRATDPRVQWGWVDPRLEVYFELVTLYCIRGDLEKAEKFYDKMSQEAQKLDEKVGHAYERWAYGLLALAQGNLGDAGHAFRESSELWNLLKNPYNYARTKLEFGKMRSENNDEVEARKSVEEALAIFSRLGARLDMEKVEKIARG